MDERKFLQQVYSKIRKREDLNIKLRDTCIEIDDGENLIFKIDSKGGMFYSAERKVGGMVDKLHDEIQPIVCSVDEYLKAMESATELKAVDFNMPYKRLAEFNGVVLAGTEHSDGSFEFATWNYINGSLHLGHYFDDYEEAKENFVTRSNLVQQSKIFTEKELIQIYRCTEDTLNNGYELSDEQSEVLENVQEKIKKSVTEFDTKLQAEIDRECENEINQTM